MIFKKKNLPSILLIVVQYVVDVLCYQSALPYLFNDDIKRFRGRNHYERNENKSKALFYVKKGKKRTNRKKSGFVATSNLPHSDTNRLLPNQTHLFHYQPPGFSRSYGL